MDREISFVLAALNRRRFMGSSAAIAAGLSARAWGAAVEKPVMARVIVDNDFAGDPDALFQLAHHVLCRSVKIPLIIGSHLPEKFGGPASASAARTRVHDLLRMMDLDDRYPVLAGSEVPIAKRGAWQPSPATAAIVREAMREDRTEPLVYAAGGGVTELALAWLSEPRIGRRIKLVWIGGREHPGIASPPPGPDEAEFNFAIDAIAAQVIFNESDIEIWQVPRDAYRQMLYSRPNWTIWPRPAGWVVFSSRRSITWRRCWPPFPVFLPWPLQMSAYWGTVRWSH